MPGTLENNATKHPTLLVHEIYLSVQGEATWAGLPCVFLRLTGCPLRCNYCDTEHAFYGGTRLTVNSIMESLAGYGCKLVEVTGGEPLAQPGCIDLLERLVNDGYTVLLETSGALDVSKVPPAVHKILDLKTPDSGEHHRNLESNLDHLTERDEIKFVLCSRKDYEWARDYVRNLSLPERCRSVLFSCAFGRCDPKDVVQWMLEDQLFEVRFQLQMHKFIWPPEQRGV